MSQRTEQAARRRLPTLRRYILAWFAGCAIVMVFAYTELLDYYFERGIDLRTQATMERVAEHHLLQRQQGRAPLPPSGPNLAAYDSLEEIPEAIRSGFRLRGLEHGEIRRRLNFDPDGDDGLRIVDTGDLCVEGRCELIYLYPYRLAEGEWLYLVHGVVGTRSIYQEFRLTEAVAFAVGALFAGLLLVVAILVMRGIDAPLRSLERWSAKLDAVDGDRLPPPPDLRFSELDSLARRLEDAFGRMREGVEMEQRFLRHASHELRTPISVLSANVELIDRLGERPDRPEEERASLLRQYRALAEIRLLIDTILWLNRKSESPPQAEPVDLGGELRVAVDDHRHLLEGRSVSLEVSGQGDVGETATTLEAPLAPVRIVLANIIRNAFQHSSNGIIRIEVGPASVSVANAPASIETSADQDADGFGLGLELVAQLCARLDWRFHTEGSPHSWRTSVEFFVRES